MNKQKMTKQILATR